VVVDDVSRRPGGTGARAGARSIGLLLPWVLLAFLVGVLVGRSWPRPPPPEVERDYADLYQRLAPVVVDVTIEEPRHRVGSGFAIGDRRVVTARHLVLDASWVTVRAVDGRSLRAEVVGTDARTDVAILETDLPGLTPAILGTSSQLRIGDEVLAIGNPYGLGHSLAVGVVGSRGRRLEGGVDVGFLQLTIPLNPGNSGGPIFDERGEVVGVLAGTHSQGQSIAFAVPVEVLVDTLPALQRGARVSRAYLGVRTERRGDAVVVTSAIPSGPAARSGVLAGDRIVAVDGAPVDSPEALRTLLDSYPARSRVALELVRLGEALEIEVVLTDWAEHPVVTAGMTLRPLPGTGGEVVAVRPRSRSEQAGIAVGDVVRAVNGMPVQAPADVQDLLSAGAAARVEVERNGVPAFFELDGTG